MKKLSKVILFLFVFMLPVAAIAQEVESDRRGKFSILDKHERAPFSGVLYDALGNAIILSERRRAMEEKVLAIEEVKEMMRAEFKKEFELLESKRQAEKEKFEGILAVKDEQIKKLEKEATKKGLPGIAWFGIGAGTGAIGTLIAIAVIAL